MSALNTQINGTHYKELAIQPVEFIHANGIGYMEGNVIKYVTRWRSKGGLADLHKAKHYIELLIELEQKQAAPNMTSSNFSTAEMSQKRTLADLIREGPRATK